MDWDWDAEPTYESDRIRIDGSLPPLIFYDMKRPRQAEDDEIALMTSLADHHLERGLPFIALVRHVVGTGVIAARHREAFTDWLEARRDALKRDYCCVVIVMPEPIFRAVLRVVYRFRAPPLRTITAPDVSSAAASVRSELERMGQRMTPQMNAFLDSLGH